MLQMLLSLNQRQYIALAGFGSFAMLATAFVFQYVGGLAPCEMCLWQRWPHAAAVALGAVGLAMPSAFIAVVGAVSMVVNVGLSILHTGVEREWWVLNLTCTGGGEDLSSFSASDLLDPTVGEEIVLCTEVPWSLLGLSMASWNGLVCLCLAGVWVWAAFARRA